MESAWLRIYNAIEPLRSNILADCFYLSIPPHKIADFVRGLFLLNCLNFVFYSIYFILQNVFQIFFNTNLKWFSAWIDTSKTKKLLLLWYFEYYCREKLITRLNFSMGMKEMKTTQHKNKVTIAIATNIEIYVFVISLTKFMCARQFELDEERMSVIRLYCISIQQNKFRLSQYECAIIVQCLCVVEVLLLAFNVNVLLHKTYSFPISKWVCTLHTVYVCVCAYVRVWVWIGC